VCVGVCVCMCVWGCVCGCVCVCVCGWVWWEMGGECMRVGASVCVSRRRGRRVLERV
jgi:hypothetical protein